MLKYDKSFTMSDNKNNILKFLEQLQLSADEAALYLELLKGPASHLQLARATGINRTKVYRLADELQMRSLISTQQSDKGVALVASDPSALEVELITKEEELKKQRVIFRHVLPRLEQIKQDAQGDFVVNTYEGVQGFKQMLWHELRAQGEILFMGKGTIEQLVGSTRWSEKHRARTVEVGYTIRQLLNPTDNLDPFTKHDQFMDVYNERLVSEDVLLMKQTTSIYNDTVATFHWRDEQKVGFEVVSKSYATMMRQIFEHYWALAKPHKRELKR